MARLSIRLGFNLATFAVITLIPLIAAGIFILAVQAQTPFRYDPVYFAPPTPNATAPPAMLPSH